MKCRCGGTLKLVGALPATTTSGEVRRYQCDKCNEPETVEMWYHSSNSASTSWSKLLGLPSR